MKKLNPEAETPIFQELNRELGELPELDIHDFDQHAFEFLREYDEQKSPQSSAEDSNTDEEAPEPVAASAGAATAGAGAAPGGARRGGRRRKGN